MAHTLTIGQVAKTSGVAAKTIRYYEEIGVLPSPHRAASGYRLYDQSGVERLRFIRRARTLGLALHQLKTLTATLNGGARPALRPRLLALVREQHVAVTEQIAELKALRQQLEQVLKRMETSAPRRHAGGCRCLETEQSELRP
jgi:MerR family transcriptional regulator, copper efflux regulator